MKQYELMAIAKSGIGEEGAQQAFNSISDTITSANGRILNSDSLGRRKFAYEIGHEKEGFYQVIVFESDPSKVLSLKNKLNLDANIIRYLITATGK